MRPVCKGLFYAVFTVKSQVSSVHNLMTPFFWRFDLRMHRRNGGIDVFNGGRGAHAEHRFRGAAAQPDGGGPRAAGALTNAPPGRPRGLLT